MKRFLLLLIITTLAAVTPSCQSEPPVFDEAMEPADYFQRAQERVEVKDYATAITYYYKCKEKFPDDLDKNTWASYEIAFLYHKMENDEKALVLLDELLALYQQDKDGVLPPAPKILAEKVKDNIINKGQYDNKTVKPSPTPSAVK
jgi:outer membrane protein assembly factor BamD (BamD/ComL family)